ncbi:MAG: hypothetical protein JXA41_14195 [Deltaproteobacteria bacterium]|nr:hypothetical protein [Deltaproteobacteria bacterium]
MVIVKIHRLLSADGIDKDLCACGKMKRGPGAYLVPLFVLMLSVLLKVSRPPPH